MGGAPSSGITTDFIASLNATPRMTATTAVRAQFAGRTKPRSRHGVRERQPQSSTGSALNEPSTAAAASTASVASTPTGPKPRSRAASPSSGSGSLISGLPPLARQQPQAVQDDDHRAAFVPGDGHREFQLPHR